MRTAMRHKTPQKTNFTYMLMQAQEQKHLAERLINLRPTVDNK